MKTKIWYCLFAATVLIAVTFWVRQRTLNELAARNQSLRQELAAQLLQPAAEPTPIVKTTNLVAALNQDEHMELLRLRGQILPLRYELLAISNRLVTVAQAKPKQANAIASQILTEAKRKAEIEEGSTFMRSEPYRSARNFSIALGGYIKAHSGELPDDLAKLKDSAGNSLHQDANLEFQLMRSGKVDGEAQAYTLVARTKEPQQLADGRWRRLYISADGGTATAYLGPLSSGVTMLNWKAWESQHEALMKKVPKREETQP